MKTTLATIKSFVKKNDKQLYIKLVTSFNKMVDCVMPETDDFSPIKSIGTTDESRKRHTLGISGAWFVGSSRDYFYNYEDGLFCGYKIINCCGEFVLAVKKENQPL